jgi:hypothetical protein
MTCDLVSSGAPIGLKQWLRIEASRYGANGIGVQERPCTRCIKRNIGHLCHDEPRDTDAKKPKPNQQPHPLQQHEAADDGHDSQSEIGRSSISSMGPPPAAFDGVKRRTSSGFGAGMLGQRGPLPTAIVQPNASAALQGTMLTGNNSNSNQCVSSHRGIGWSTAAVVLVQMLTRLEQLQASQMRG